MRCCNEISNKGGPGLNRHQFEVNEVIFHRYLDDLIILAQGIVE